MLAIDDRDCCCKRSDRVLFAQVFQQISHSCAAFHRARTWVQRYRYARKTISEYQSRTKTYMNIHRLPYLLMRLDNSVV